MHYSGLRVLHLCLNDDYSVNPITRGFEKAGCVVLEVDWKKYISEMPVFDVPIFWQNILIQIEQIRPHIVFMQLSPEVLTREMAREFSRYSFVCNWTGDIRNDMGWMEAIGKDVSLSLFSNTKNVKDFNFLNMKADYLQVGFDEQVYVPYKTTDWQRHGIVFMGNNYARRKGTDFPLTDFRVQMCIQLKKMFKDDFSVYGSDWDDFLGHTTSLGTKAEVERYNYALAAINLSHYSYGRYSSDRLFRIMASGTLALTHRYPGIEQDFIDGEHLVIWDNISDLIEKCHYYLDPKNEFVRKKIADAGCKYVHANCTWENRAKELINLINTKYLPKPMEPNDEWILGLSKLSPEKKFSQYGEDDYLQYIFKCIGTHKKFFVDFGAGNGINLSNTRYFKDALGWNGLMMDADNGGSSDVMQEFITASNIVDLFKKYKVPIYFDLLSIDVDGNDFYILDAILQYFNPRVIIAEFNGTIAPDISKTIVYNEKHQWGNDDYYGFSFLAGKRLAEKFGYKVIFQNHSTNMYMIRRDLLSNPEKEIEVSYPVLQYHAHNPNGEWLEVLSSVR